MLIQYEELLVVVLLFRIIPPKIERQDCFVNIVLILEPLLSAMHRQHDSMFVTDCGRLLRSPAAVG